MSHTPHAASRFDSGAALGFALEVFRARPVGFIVLVLFQTVLMTGAALAQLYLMAEPGAEFMRQSAAVQAGEDVAAMMSASAAYTLASLGGALLSLAVFVITEAAWLRLFARGRTRILPTGGDELRLMVVLAAVWGLVFLLWVFGAILIGVVAGVLGAVGGTALAVLGAILAGVVLVGVIIWLSVRFSPAAGLTMLRGRIALGEAFSGSKRFYWSLLGGHVLAWLILIVGMIVITAPLSLIPGPYRDALTAAFNPSDPAAQFEAYGAIFASRGALAGYGAILVVQSVLLAPFYALARGVGVKAALVIDHEADAPGS
jgi:hypothetical protein